MNCHDMTTNETFFFRDKIPFDHLRETMLPALLRARANRRTLRIWSAASSSGQEPYSIAMCLKEYGAALNGWRIEIVATDISQGVLEKSKAGIFSQFEVQRGLPIQLLVKYFRQIGDMPVPYSRRSGRQVVRTTGGTGNAFEQLIRILTRYG